MIFEHLPLRVRAYLPSSLSLRTHDCGGRWLPHDADRAKEMKKKKKKNASLYVYPRVNSSTKRTSCRPEKGLVFDILLLLSIIASQRHWPRASTNKHRNHESFRFLLAAIIPGQRCSARSTPDRPSCPRHRCGKCPKKCYPPTLAPFQR